MEYAVHYIFKISQLYTIICVGSVEIIYLDIIETKKGLYILDRSFDVHMNAKCKQKKRSKMYFWGEPKCKNYVLLCPSLPRALIWRTRSILVAIFGRIIGGAFTSGIFLQIFNLPSPEKGHFTVCGWNWQIVQPGWTTMFQNTLI